MIDKKFYLTIPIFYANSDLHMGHAYTTVLADIVARYRRGVGERVHFLAGSDEHGDKIAKAAKAVGKDTQLFVDERAASFEALFRLLNISNDDFIRTTDRTRHFPAVVAMWGKLVASGDIYKAEYESLYCVGCEETKTDKDLVDGKCPLHNLVPEQLKEENYFFKLSRYTEKLKILIETDELRIRPVTRKNEILSLIKEGLSDVSFSRPAEKVSWGIPVPGDASQVMYVWCDALTNYISAIGYPDENKMREWWPADVQMLGKDILRFHAAIWPAMLMSAGLPIQKEILCHGFITSGGKKMSKTMGNVIDPRTLVSEYGVDAFRYFLAREISPFDDGDITIEKFKDAYNANLANGLGNLTSRIMKMATSYIDTAIETGDTKHYRFAEYEQAMSEFRVNDAANVAWAAISELDREIQETEPFKLYKTDPDKAREIVRGLVVGLSKIVPMITPIMPETAAKIDAAIKEHQMPEALFMRK